MGKHAKILLKCHPLHQVNAIVYLLSHVTYVTAFNKCSNLVDTPSKTIIPYYNYEQAYQKYVRYPAAAHVFLYILLK